MSQGINSGLVKADIAGQASSYPAETAITVAHHGSATTNTSTVPAGKIWVVVSAFLYCATASGTYVRFVDTSTGLTNDFLGTVTAENNLTFNGVLILNAGDSIAEVRASVNDSTGFTYYEVTA